MAQEEDYSKQSFEKIKQMNFTVRGCWNMSSWSILPKNCFG